MSGEQFKDQERFAAYVEREGMVSAMNDTKWREVIQCLGAIPGLHVVFRVRCVRDPLDAEPRCESSFPWHVPTYKEIEWFEIDPLVRMPSGAVDRGHSEDFRARIVAALKAIPVPVSLEGRYVRIWGYYRPGAEPDLR